MAVDMTCVLRPNDARNVVLRWLGVSVNDSHESDNRNDLSLTAEFDQYAAECFIMQIISEMERCAMFPFISGVGICSVFEKKSGDLCLMGFVQRTETVHVPSCRDRAADIDQ